MFIPIRELIAAQKSVAIDTCLEVPMIASEASVQVASDVPITLVAQGVGDVVHMTGVAQLRLQAQCARCLCSFSRRFDIHFEERVSDRSTEEDVLRIEEGEYDVRHMVQEQFSIQLPMVFVCHNDCKGLCTVCGADRNVCDCMCSPSYDVRWEALASWTDRPHAPT